MTFCKINWPFWRAKLSKFHPLSSCQPQRTYIYRVQSSVWRLLNYWPPTPSPPSECVLPRTKGGVVHTRRPVRGWGFNISEDARHWIVLLQYTPSTMPTLPQSYTKFWLTRASLLLTTCRRTDRLTYRHRCDWNTAEIQSGRQTERQTFWQWQTFTNRHIYNRHTSKHIKTDMLI